MLIIGDFVCISLSNSRLLIRTTVNAFQSRCLSVQYRKATSHVIAMFYDKQMIHLLNFFTFNLRFVSKL